VIGMIHSASSCYTKPLASKCRNSVSAHAGSAALSMLFVGLVTQDTGGRACFDGSFPAVQAAHALRGWQPGSSRALLTAFPRS
jgi:predicted NAD/FAD-binding protein